MLCKNIEKCKERKKKDEQYTPYYKIGCGGFIKPKFKNEDSKIIMIDKNEEKGK